MTDSIIIGNDKYTLQEFDHCFETATDEGERRNYEKRQKLLAMMELSQDEESLYERIMRLSVEIAKNGINPAIQKEIASGTKQIDEQYHASRYWQYVYAKQSEAYQFALRDAGIDLDAMEPKYEDNQLVKLFRESYVLLEIYPPSHIPFEFKSKEKPGAGLIVSIIRK